MTLFALMSSSLWAQYTAVRVNTLALATGTLNAGVDVALSDKWSIDMQAMWNPFLGGSTAVMAGLRRWRFEPNVGWFWGLNTAYSSFEVDDSSGWLTGLGSSMGYSWILNRRWNFSLEGGLGVYYIKDCFLLDGSSLLEDIIVRHRQRIMLLPSKLEATFSYLF